MRCVTTFVLLISLLASPCSNVIAGRYYDARVARFTTVDPLLSEKTPDDVFKKYGLAPFSMSPYNYGTDNPVRYVDPDGRNPLVYFLAALALSAMYPEPLNAPRHNDQTYSSRQGLFEAASFAADATMVVGATKALVGAGMISVNEGLAKLGKEGSQFAAQAGADEVCTKAGSEVVEKGAKAAKTFLGEGAELKVNKAGDAVFVSKDGTKRIRFDFNKPSPHKSPHVDVEQLSKGKWIKGKAYPRDLPKE
jgi:RHS repeat-associated protein